MKNGQTNQDRAKTIRNIFTGAFLLLLFVGIAVCVICDLAISHTFTWSLYPISAITFSGLVVIPIIKFGKKGICGSLIVCSIFIIPFLYVLNSIIKVSDLFLPISISMAFIGIVYIWVIFLLFTKLKTRKLLATAITLLMLIPVDVLITFTLSRTISESLNIWDIIGFFIVTIVAIVLFIIDFVAKKK